MKTYILTLLVAVAATALNGGCYAHRGFQGYAESLRLVIELADAEARVGDTIGATYVLSNVGQEAVDACVGKPWGYDLMGSQESIGAFEVIDHPSCLRAFVLAPGDTLRLDHTLEVFDVGDGGVEVTGWIQIVNPNRCTRRGCQSMAVRSASAPLLHLHRN